MTMGRLFEGSLFAEDFLCEAITELRDWRGVADEQLADLKAALRGLYRSGFSGQVDGLNIRPPFG